MSKYSFDLGGPEELYVFRPQRSETAEHAESGDNWDRFRRKLARPTEPNWTLDDPSSWLSLAYILVGFGILTLFILGIYYILQSAKVAAAKRQMLSDRAMRRAQLQWYAPEADTDTNGGASTFNTINNGNNLVDTSGKNPELCRTKNCFTSDVSKTTAMLENLPRLTFSPSTGIVPTRVGTSIHGGLGRDICLGCKCGDPSRPIPVPYYPGGSTMARSGEGYLQDPFIGS